MKRGYEKLIEARLREFPCVALLGARQCGKTTMLAGLGAGWKIFDIERRADYEVIAADPDLFFRLNPQKVCIDEAQLLPSIFSALRVAIDAQRGSVGRFVVTGSSSPDLIRSISESLAGRVAIIEMAPFSFAETKGHFVSHFFKHLGEGKLDTKELEQSRVWARDRDIQNYWFRGGYPEPWIKGSESFALSWFENYVQTYLYRDIAQLFPNLQRERFRQFLGMLGGLSGTLVNAAEVARVLGISQPTVRDYLSIAHDTYLWRSLPAFVRGNPYKRIVKHARGYLRDVGLLHHLLHIADGDSLLSHPAMGRSWEALCIEEIFRGLHARGIHFSAYHYRTAAGAEIDLIVEGRWGLLPIEIKHTSHTDPRRLRALADFVSENKCPCGIVVNNDTMPRFYSEKILGLPFAAL